MFRLVVCCAAISLAAGQTDSELTAQISRLQAIQVISRRESSPCTHAVLAFEFVAAFLLAHLPRLTLPLSSLPCSRPTEPPSVPHGKISLNLRSSLRMATSTSVFLVRGHCGEFLVEDTVHRPRYFKPPHNPTDTESRGISSPITTSSGVTSGINRLAQSWLHEDVIMDLLPVDGA